MQITAPPRGTGRRPRALLGLALGIAGLVLFAVLLAVDDAPLLGGM